MYSLDELTAGIFFMPPLKSFAYDIIIIITVVLILQVLSRYPHVLVTIIVHGIKSKQFHHNFQLGVKTFILCSSKE